MLVGVLVPVGVAVGASGLARFVSPDSIVPGASSGVGGAGGSVGQENNSKLTVDFHELGFLTSMNKENAFTLQKGFWFQLDGGNQKTAKAPWGPENPQAMNRYTYTLNNPVRYTDPSGHCTTGPGCGGVVVNNSSTPVLVYGTKYDPTNPKADANGLVTDWYEVPPHKSSADVGIYDADAVAPYYPDSYILSDRGGYYGGGHSVYKLVNNEKVIIEDYPLCQSRSHPCSQRAHSVPKEWPDIPFMRLVQIIRGGGTQFCGGKGQFPCPPERRRRPGGH